MSTLVANCPRCNVAHTTFDLIGENVVGVKYDWQRVYELPAICRHCHRYSVLVAKQTDIGSDKQLRTVGFLSKFDGSANDYVAVSGYISLKDKSAAPPPEHLPKDIHQIFVEGATCLAVSCPNAAGTMFRMCVDMATKKLLPDGEADGLNTRVRRDLGLRLPWLFQHGLLPVGLEDLSKCIREDGNDGAHAGTLTLDDAENLVDFTMALLERLYTEPARLKIAQDRRDARRKT